MFLDVFGECVPAPVGDQLYLQKSELVFTSTTLAKFDSIWLNSSVEGDKKNMD